MRYSLLLLALFNLLDAWLTLVLVVSGQAVEANPLCLWIINHIGIVVFTMLIKQLISAWILLGYLFYNEFNKIGRVVTSVLATVGCILYSFVFGFIVWTWLQ